LPPLLAPATREFTTLAVLEVGVSERVLETARERVLETARERILETRDGLGERDFADSNTSPSLPLEP